MLCSVLVVTLALSLGFADRLTSSWFQAFSVVFAAICIQATPFVVLGVLVSTALKVVVPAQVWARTIPKNDGCAVPVVGLAGLLLPGCECGSVPVARSLMSSGVAPAPAVAFLLAAPAINPVVLVATAVAFPGHPMMVLARFGASFATAVVVGWIWQRVGRGIGPAPVADPHASSWTRLPITAAHDLSGALGLVVVGAAMTALLKLVLPQWWLEHAQGNAITAVLVLALLAVVLAVCSEADAFIAAFFSQFSGTAQLAFMVVGPMVDLKLIAMQVGLLGRRFALRLMPLTFAVAVTAALVAGSVVL